MTAHAAGMNLFTKLLWALIGLLLTIAGTFFEAFVALPSWSFSPAIALQTLNVKYQVGAVLLTACLGGRSAGAIAQIAYLMLGLAGLPVFNNGGGWDYFQQSTFGYLVGFVPGAWLCGHLAFKSWPKLEALALSCLSGLAVIHGVGVAYLIGSYGIGSGNAMALPLWQAVLKYSLLPLPGQLAIICAVSVIAFTLRHLMFY